MSPTRQAQKPQEDDGLGTITRLTDRYGISTALLVFGVWFGWNNFLNPLIQSYHASITEIASTNDQLKDVAREVGDKNATLIEALSLEVGKLRDKADDVGRNAEEYYRRAEALSERTERNVEKVLAKLEELGKQ